MVFLRSNWKKLKWYIEISTQPCDRSRQKPFKFRSQGIYVSHCFPSSCALFYLPIEKEERKNRYEWYGLKAFSCLTANRKNFSKWNWLCFFKIDISYIPRLNWNVNEQENLQKFDSSSYTVSPHQSWEKYKIISWLTKQKLIKYASWTRVQRWLQIISLVGNFQNNILLAEDRNWKQSHYEPVVTLD